MANLRSRAKALEKQKKVKDYDPEDDDRHGSDSDESGEEIETKVNAGREHYEEVGKSRLRKPDQPNLGAKYEGVKVSRKALEEEDDNQDPFAPVDDSDDEDPFALQERDRNSSDEESQISEHLHDDVAIDEDDEIDSDEALGESDIEKFKSFTFRGSKTNAMVEAGSYQQSKEDSDDGSEQADEIPSDDSDIEMDEEEENISEDNESIAFSASSTPPPATKPSQLSEREALRNAISSSSTAGLASTLSASAATDVKKGQAVKTQQQTFDRLLDARIKLQKGLTIAGDLPDACISDDEVALAAQQAEDAALSLWSTINSIRHDLLESLLPQKSTSAKRKLPATATRSTSSSSLWQETQTLNSQTLTHHRTTLDKWHAKTQPAIEAVPRSKLLPSSKSPSSSRLSDILSTYLSTTAASLIATSTASNSIYDDTQFYQSLLRDLIASRSNDQSLSTLDTTTPLPTKLHASGSRNKKVDTKASKGRKIRYTVHEKLQNFMAPEDRGTWEESARREFFASLFGKAGLLDEHDHEEDDGGDEEEVALRLFRT